jgi:spermidine/putrescine transport system permease protein
MSSLSFSGKAVRVIALGALVFIYAPVLVIAIYSFNDTTFDLTWQGFTLRWYQTLFENDLVRIATLNSLVLGLSSTLISTILGSLLAYGLYRHQLPGGRWLRWVFYIPVVIPDIVVAVALLIMLHALQTLFNGFTELFSPGLTAMIIGHVTLQIAFVTVVVRTRLELLDRQIVEAAHDLYADTWRTLRYVVIPAAAPGIISGALLALTLSIDDFVLSFFTAGPDSLTLPIYIYSLVRRGITPDVNALSTLIIALTLFLLLLIYRVQAHFRKSRVKLHK